MRLIDAEKAIEAVCDKCPISFKEKCEWRDNGHCSMKVALEVLPTVDAVEVVRCKDCKYWNNKTDLTYCEKKSWLGTDATDYCSFGERGKE